ncbi:MAG: tetratricopeptide repeat protein [Bacteroidales bacterium]|nr:tetratricopeptide repeat protein [Lachnoclostridium sp.]MCM1385466.1 tetratricopeptide repeat protein [Lachnoclostridium sp.]MCM1466248.1 tetratricopeptide repeat protein [Bacteroidales bacterium]
MSEEMMFAVLGIDKTKDEETIRNAYRELLQHTHPEENPEGFKRLREAYEDALKYARTPDTDEKESVDETPVGQWMEKVKAVYFSLSRRLDGKEWERLLKDDVCVSLEDSENAKWKLFGFLTQNYQLPGRIYRILDNAFYVKDNESSFKEHLPVNFVDFVLRKIVDTDGNTDFDYESFQGPDDGDYDGFLDEYYKLTAQTGEKNADAAWQTLQAMERLGISHPQFELQRAYTHMLAGRKEEALALIRPLSEKYRTNPQIQVLGGEILYECGCHEEAEQQLLPYANQNYYQAEKYLSFCEAEKNNLAAAITHCGNAMRDRRGTELKEYLKDLDRQFLQLAEQEEFTTEENIRCLIDALSRNDRSEEALELLENRPDYAEHMTDLHYSKGCLYMRLQDYEAAVKEFSLWRQDLLAAGDSVDRELEMLSYRYEGEAWFKLGKEGKEGAFLKALEVYTQASELAPDNQSFLQCIVDTMIELKKYEDAVRLAEEILAKNSQWFPAYVQKQKACYELGRAQEVVDCFYAARRIYQAMPEIYERAADIFIQYRQYKDAENIFRLAKEAQVDDIRLDILTLKNLRLKEYDYLQELIRQKRRADFRLDKELTAFVKEVKAKYKENPGSDKHMCTLFLELGLTESDRRHDKDAIRYFRRALKYEDRPLGHYYLAGALMDNKEYDAALPEYQKYEEKGPKLTERYCIHVAHRFRSAGRRETAIDYFKKALAINPQNQEANGAIANLYRLIMWSTGNIYYGRLGMTYMDRQLEIVPENALDLRRKGLLLSNMGCEEESLPYFDRSLELEESHYSYGGKGKALRYLGRYEEALECLQRAIDIGGSNGPESVVYGDGGSCMCKLGRYKEAEEWFLKGIERFRSNPDEWLYSMLKWMYDKLGEFEKARAVCLEELNAGLMEQETYERECLEYDQLLDKQGDISYTERARQMAEKYDSVDAWAALANCFLFEGDAQSALQPALTAYEKIKKSGEKWSSFVLFELMECHRMLGDVESASAYVEEFYREIEKEYSYNKELSAVEQYINDINGGVENAYELAKCEIARGNLDKAEEYLKWMQGQPMCRKCTKEVCNNIMELQGHLYEARGEKQKAVECYKKSLAVFKANADLKYRIKRLESIH